MKKTTTEGKLIIVSGPSGVGKGTILRHLFDLNEFPLVLSVSVTTRKPRPGEKNGVDYHFLTGEEFARRRLQGDFLECFEVFAGGDWYGTLRSEVQTALDRGDWVVLEIDVKGAREVLKSFPDAITVFILPPDEKTLRDRLTRRGTESAAAVEKRLAAAREEINRSESYRCRIVNDDLSKAVETLRQFLREERQ